MGKFARFIYLEGVSAYSYNAPDGFNGLIILKGSNHSGLVLSNHNELVNIVGCTINGRNIGIIGAVVWDVILIG